ncbi:hypothetical protein QQ054_32440 [Oscillatoria amoena NRMC-F 0135]|nr:hypothetical protein [Oscillatoria amoena NRMC-F 0135]
MNALNQVQFTDTYHLPLDDKKRITLPYRWRDAGGQTIDVYHGLFDERDNTFTVMPAATFNEMVRSFGVGSTLTPGQITKARQRLTGNAKHLSLDKNGRICLSVFRDGKNDLITAAGIGGQVVLLGGGDRFRIMSPEQYEAEQKAADMPMGQIMDMIGL